MSMTLARAHLAQKGYADRIIEPQEITATVEQAAAALGCLPAHIAKTISVYDDQNDGAAMLILAAGDAKIDNKKFRAQFSFKPHMLAAEDVEPRTNHAIGGVCPFGVPAHVRIFCDISLQRFAYVYPAAGNAHSGVKLTCYELMETSEARGWVDVCKGWAAV